MLIRIGLLIITVTVVVTGSIPSSFIGTDLTELVTLRKTLIERYSTELTRQIYGFSCLYISECCPNNEEYLYNAFLKNILDIGCWINGPCESKYIQPVIPVNVIDPNSIVFQSEARQKRIEYENEQMKIVCSKEEVFAYFCERDNMEKFQSCQDKMLEMVARKVTNDNGTFYDNYISQLKEDYISDIKRLNELSSLKV